MVDSALAKLDWAAKRIVELNDRLAEVRPFSYVLETNHQTGQRSTFAKRNEAEIGHCAIACGEIVQHIRSALDHAYWSIVSPFATTPREMRAVQFPFSETAARLEEAISNRLAKRVSQTFFDALVELAPHGEAGGNKPLYLIDFLNIPDKHRDLTPIGDYKTLDGVIIRNQVPDFPFIGVNIFGMNTRDVAWQFAAPCGFLGRIVEQELDVPIDIILPIGELGEPQPFIPLLNHLLRTARDTIAIIRDSV